MRETLARRHKRVHHSLRQCHVQPRSVIPVFVQQIKQGKPLTVTDPAMTRFLMSLEASVDLVEYAFDGAEPGDLS